MQSINLEDDSLVEIATFLARRWSENNKIQVEISDTIETKTRLKENKIILTPLHKRLGNNFSKYRQFRTSLWFESMRIKYCKKILSNDHAFGFILNSMETLRIEQLGKKIWKGMNNEILFYYTYMLASRPQLHTIYGRARIVEAFYQYLMFGAINGDIQASHLQKVKKATILANTIIKTSITNDNADWLKENVGQIIKTLEIDSLLTIPIIPFMKNDMPLTDKEFLKILNIILSKKQSDSRVDSDALLEGNNIYDEYKTLLQKDQKTRNKGLIKEAIGIKIPSTKNIDESAIYDQSLVDGLKMKFREWKTGWKEQHHTSGDEFDEESYIENGKPFFIDEKKSIKNKITILLDHSSSIAPDAKEYKKATLALCQVLDYLKVKFSVYAFSTQNRSMVCWSIKPEHVQWNNIAAKRLAQILANGSTPLAEVYDKMFPVLQSKRPNIFLTLTDGEPSDPDAVRIMTKSLTGLGISMVALGFAPSTLKATTIASNLKHLGYDKTMAVSRLHDIPRKVIHILSV